MRLYTAGIADFERIRQDGRIYIDKTDLIYKLTRESQFVFLSRPRRFGKSLLCSTLKYYFEGRKDLFEGLAIAELEKDWKQYPVLHFDMSACKNKYEIGQIIEELHSQLDDQERKYKMENTKGSPGKGAERAWASGIRTWCPSSSQGRGSRPSGAGRGSGASSGAAAPDRGGGQCSS